MHSAAPRLTSRRAFLRGALGLTGIGLLGAGALAGCDLLGQPGPDVAPNAELDGLLAHTVALGHQYDEAITAVPALTTALTPLREAHRAHAEAIAAAIGRPVPSANGGGAPAPTERKAALAALRAAEKAAQAESLAACLDGSPRLAPLLGSITAARAAHQEVLA